MSVTCLWNKSHSNKAAKDRTGLGAPDKRRWEETGERGSHAGSPDLKGRNKNAEEAISRRSPEEAAASCLSVYMSSGAVLPRARQVRGGAWAAGLIHPDWQKREKVITPCW